MPFYCLIIALKFDWGRNNRAHVIPLPDFEKRKLSIFKQPNSFLNNFMGGVKTERVFPGLSVLRKNNKMEVLYPEK
jgi:hypothetical protein